MHLVAELMRTVTGMRSKEGWRWKVFGVILLSVTCLAFIVQWVASKKLHAMWLIETVAAIDNLRPYPPEGVETEEWDRMVAWTAVGVPNCFCDTSHIIEPDEFRNFKRELVLLLKPGADKNDIEWIWDQMAEHSKIGKAGYVNRFRPLNKR